VADRAFCLRVTFAGRYGSSSFFYCQADAKHRRVRFVIPLLIAHRVALGESQRKGPATDVVFNPATSRLELVRQRQR
jgi:hypothetical protein